MLRLINSLVLVAAILLIFTSLRAADIYCALVCSAVAQTLVLCCCRTRGSSTQQCQRHLDSELLHLVFWDDRCNTSTRLLLVVFLWTMDQYPLHH